MAVMVNAALGYTTVVIKVMVNAALGFVWRLGRLALVEVALSSSLAGLRPSWGL